MRVGDKFTIMDGDFGPYQARVISVEGDNVVVSFNSPKLGRIEHLLGTMGVRKHD